MNTSPYQHIIVGLDLIDDCERIVQKAAAMAAAFNAKLSLAHVLEPITFAYSGDIPVDLSGIQEQQTQKAKTQLAQLAEKSPYPVTGQHVVVGQPAAELHYLAEKEEADLILVGSHARKGLALLLGSTPNSVLQGARCDVLAVRVHPKSDSE